MNKSTERFKYGTAFIDLYQQVLSSLHRLDGPIKDRVCE